MWWNHKDKEFTNMKIEKFIKRIEKLESEKEKLLLASFLLIILLITTFSW